MRILLAIMTGAGRENLLRRHAEPCASAAVRCLAFSNEDAPHASGHVHLVSHGRYCKDGLCRVPVCCKSNRTLRSGAVPYFCQPHVAHTASAQKRFLPALTHAKRAMHADEQWLVLVDDDSLVRSERLLSVLSAIQAPAERALYLGDVAPVTGVRAATRGQEWVPFACGGAGTLLSRAAVMAMDFAACARRWADGCYQSDWMIGRCASDAGVRRVGDTVNASTGAIMPDDGHNRIDGSGPLSCGACTVGPKCLSSRYIAAARARLQSGCAFAQYVGTVACDRTGDLGARLCREAATAAISHTKCGAPSSFESSARDPVKERLR